MQERRTPGRLTQGLRVTRARRPTRAPPRRAPTRATTSLAGQASLPCYRAPMIGRLTGVPLEDEDGALVVDVGGVGYELLVPQGTVGRSTRELDGRVTLHVHTHVREDQITLFGFASASERL